MERVLNIELHDKSAADEMTTALRKIPGVIHVERIIRRAKANLFIWLHTWADVEHITEEVKAHDERAWVLGNEPD